MAVVVAAYAPALIGRGGHEGPLLPCLRASGGARLNHPAGVATKPHRQPAGYRLAGLRAVGRGLRVRRLRGPANRTARIFNSCRPFEASGSLTSNARIKFLAEQFRGEAPIFLHSYPLSAGSPGLVGAVYGQHSAERKRACPTKEFPGAEIVFPKMT